MTSGIKALSQLFGSYLHQDWADEFASDAAAVQAMIDSEPKEALVAASNEARRLIISSMSEEKLARVITDEVGCYFDPASRGLSYREWLCEVLKRLEQTTA